MIDLYAWWTTNSFKVSIALEGLGLAYRVTLVNIHQGQQHKPMFLARSPNGEMPVIVDLNGPGGQYLTLAESGAILLYLARKGRGLIPADGVGEALTHQWLMFQLSAFGPILGQAQHVGHFHPTQAPAATRPAVQRAFARVNMPVDPR